MYWANTIAWYVISRRIIYVSEGVVGCICLQGLQSLGSKKTPNVSVRLVSPRQMSARSSNAWIWVDSSSAFGLSRIWSRSFGESVRVFRSRGRYASWAPYILKMRSAGANTSSSVHLKASAHTSKENMDANCQGIFREQQKKNQSKQTLHYWQSCTFRQKSK